MIIKPLKVKYGEARTIYTLIKTKHFFFTEHNKIWGGGGGV